MEVEVDAISTRYENIRLKDKYREKQLLESIAEQGIREPLQCVKQDEGYVLLDGFKRLRRMHGEQHALACDQPAAGN